MRDIAPFLYSKLENKGGESIKGEQNVKENIREKIRLKNLFGFMQEKKEEADSFQKWLKIEKIAEDSIILSNRRVVKLLKISPINFQLKSQLEQKAILKSYQSFLKNLNSEIQIVIMSRNTDVSQHLEEILKNTKENPPLKEMSEDYIQLVKRVITEKGTITKEFYLVIPVTQNIENEILKIREYLGQCGNVVEVCKQEEIIVLLKNFLNKRYRNVINE